MSGLRLRPGPVANDPLLDRRAVDAVGHDDDGVVLLFASTVFKGILSFSLVAVTATENTAKPQHQKGRDHGEENNVDKLKAFAHIRSKIFQPRHPPGRPPGIPGLNTLINI